MQVNTYKEEMNIIFQCLQEEDRLYRSIVLLEKEKTSAIEDRNPAELKRVSLAQEHLLEKVTDYESKRLSALNQFNVLAATNFSRVNELLQSNLISQTDKEQTGVLVENLKDSLMALRSLVNLNQEMLKQNQEFFLSLLGQLTGQEEFEENPLSQMQKSKERQATRPVFINTMG